jgi:hypothetical protein
MRKRFAFLLAVSVCLALAFTPVMADRADRTADRSKTAARGADGSESGTISDVIVRHPFQVRIADDIASTHRAESLIAVAADLEGDAAISALMQAVSMGTAGEKALAEAYARLGDLYQGAPSKQVHLYGMAMQYASEAGERARLQGRIAELGGNVFDMAMTTTQTASTRDLGPDDSCDGAVAITLPWSEVMSITDVGDHNFRSFDVTGPDGVFVRIETISQNPPFYDDSTLALWGGCDGGTAVGQLYLNDDGGEGFMSLIETGCLTPGTYFIDVYGYFEFATLFDFTLDVQVTGTCILPTPDGYEPDDDRADATRIGYPTSIPTHANGWGRAKKEIQDHSIFPSFDWDHVKLALNKNEFVRMGMAIQFPTFFNGFESIPGGTDVDSYLELLYGVEPNYGGFCNEPDLGFPNWCLSDADCDPLSGAPIPDFPPCIPIYFFTFGGSFVFFPENPLAYNDDISFSNWASELALCLPRTSPGGPLPNVTEDWIVRTMSSPAYNPTGTFLYQVQVKNEYGCNFETEPNNDFPQANPIVLGETYHGFIQESEIWGPPGPDFYGHDPDLFSFDVAEDSVVEFETTGYDLYAVDTALELYVGPDDLGLYYFTGLQNDDSIGWWSYLGAILPPANALLGNLYADADYILNTTTLYLNPNFPYTLLTSGYVYVAPTFEVEPNDTCATANAVDMGDNIGGELTVCDYDSFTFSLTGDTYVVIESDGGDTTLLLTTGAGAYLGCDDDSGPGLASRIEGCLPAGDYCAKMRPYSSFSGIASYELTFQATGSCSATNPPATIYDELYRCDGFGYASPMDEFNTCPN